jgi:hypothetical protein
MDIPMTRHIQTQEPRVFSSPEHEGRQPRRQDPQVLEQEQARNKYREQLERNVTPLENGQVGAENLKPHQVSNETNDEDSELDNGAAENNAREEDIAQQENEDLEIDDANNRP